MLLLVAGFITLARLTLSVLSADESRDALIYQVDIFLPPKEGKNETADILDIQETVKDLSDIDVLFSFKELGNPRIILVLDVEKACSWPQLTGFLSSKGYEFSVTSLYYDSDFAQELGVNMTKDMFASSFGNRDLLMGKLTFLVKGLSTLEYNDMIKWTVERQVDIINNGQQLACFRTLAEYPVKGHAVILGREYMDVNFFIMRNTTFRSMCVLLHQVNDDKVMNSPDKGWTFFLPVTQHRIDEYQEYFHGPRDYQLVVTRIENLDSYTGVCQGV